MPTIFIAGIDTDVGKTFATGLLAKYFLLNNKQVITMKLAQTGCSTFSEDIEIHRKIMNIPLLDIDKDGTTCPYIFTYPASPHLSAIIDKQEIEISKINKSISKLTSNYENLIIEGVGGIMVPLNKNITSLDFLEKEKHPVLLVSSPKLGSINHTLMSIDILKSRNIDLLGIIYNTYGDFPTEIKNDSIKVFKDYLNRYNYPSNIVEINDIDKYSINDLSNMFNKFGLF